MDRLRVTRRAVIAGTLVAAVPRSSRSVLAKTVTYTIVEVPVLDGDAVSGAIGINAAGAVVGSSAQSVGYREHGVMLRGGKLQSLGENFGSAVALNKGRQAVGAVYVDDAALAAKQLSAATWIKNKLTILPPLRDLAPGANSYGVSDLSLAPGINDKGTIVGGSSTGKAGPSDQHSPFHACVWTGGKVAELAGLGGGSVAIAVNSAGDIAGAALAQEFAFLPLSPLGFGFPRNQGTAVLWKGGKPTELGTIAGTFSAATALDDDGRVVGYSTTSGSSAFAGDAGIHAFLWDMGSMTDLGSLDGSGGSVATGINAAGTIVGYALGPGITHANDVPSMLAVLWAGGKIASLNDLLPAGSGWTLYTANGINHSGQIAGVGLNPDGAVRGFVLSPAAG